MARRIAPLDVETLFVEDLTATASAASVNNKILKIGRGQADMAWILDVSALDVSSADEKYTFLLQGCNTADFSTGAPPIENLAVIELGAGAVRDGGARSSVVGRYRLGVANEVVGGWDYVRLRLVVAGTTPTITFSSWLTNTQIKH